MTAPDSWTVPGYQVEQLLGSGGSAEVWCGRDLATDERVALKRLRPGAPAGALEALRREADLLSSLDTPYVVRLRAVVGDVLVLDLAEGGPLAALLARRGRLTAGEVVTVAAPVAQALAAAHAAGLVHGDVSPANVLFTADGMPLLADLGGARLAADRDAPVRGTAEYVAPEVAAGGVPGPASDVWSLGALCHHLLAGSPPHEGDDAEQVLGAAVLGGRAPLGLLAPQAPRALVEAVEAALDPDPGRRPSAAALSGALQRAQDPSPVRLTGGPPPAAVLPDVRDTHVVPRPPRPPDEPGPRSPRRVLSVVAAGVVAAGLLSAGVLAGVLWARSSPPPQATALPPVALPAAGGEASAPDPGGAGPPAVPSGPQPPATPQPAVTPQPPVPPPPPATPRATPPPPAASAPAVRGPDWAQVLEALGRRRERAYAEGDVAALAQVWAAGADAGRADEASLLALVGEGRTASGVRHEVRQVQEVRVEDDRVALRVVDVLPEQQVRDRTGAVVQTRPERGEAAYDVVLVREQGHWRMASLTPAA